MLISIYHDELLATPAYGFAHKFMFIENAVSHAFVQSGKIGKGFDIFKMLLSDADISIAQICC